MLVLTRKLGQGVWVTEDIRIVVVDSREGQVKLGIDAPQSTPIYRDEVYEKVRTANLRSLSVPKDHFAPVKIPEGEIITFPRGLVGFPEKKRFIVMDHSDPSLRWLQSADDPSFALLLTDPYEEFPDYRVDVSAVERNILGIRDEKEAHVYCVLRVWEEDGEKQMSMNLLGPILINPKTKKGIQLVMEKSRNSAQELVHC